jgi:hypothetical protein
VQTTALGNAGKYYELKVYQGQSAYQETIAFFKRTLQ